MLPLYCTSAVCAHRILMVKSHTLAIHMVKVTMSVLSAYDMKFLLYSLKGFVKHYNKQVFNLLSASLKYFSLFKLFFANNMTSGCIMIF